MTQFSLWIILIGLIFNLAGAIFLAYGLIISKEKAIEISVSRVSGMKNEENLKLPQVKDRLKQSRNVKIGLILLIFGFFFQLIGNLIK
jgi:hypothetical protein